METFSFPRIFKLNYDCYNTLDNAFANEWVEMSLSIISLINKVIGAITLDDKPHWAPVLDSINNARDLQRALSQFKGKKVAIQRSRESTDAWSTLLVLKPRSLVNSDFRDYVTYHLMDLFEHPINSATHAPPDAVYASGTVVIDSAASALLHTVLVNQWDSTCSQLIRLMKRISKDPKRWDTYDGWSYLNHELSRVINLQSSIKKFCEARVKLSMGTFEILTWFSTVRSISNGWCGWPGLRRKTLSTLTIIVYNGIVAE